MADLTEFTGEDALRASLLKKRTKVQEKLNDLIAKAQVRIAPLQNQIEKFDALLAVLDDGMSKKEDAYIAGEIPKCADFEPAENTPEVMTAGLNITPASDEIPAFLRAGVEKWGND